MIFENSPYTKYEMPDQQKIDDETLWRLNELLLKLADFTEKEHQPVTASTRPQFDPVPPHVTRIPAWGPPTKPYHQKSPSKHRP